MIIKNKTSNVSYIRNTLLCILCTFAIFVVLGQSATAQTGHFLGTGGIVKVKTATCGYLSGKWVAGSKLKTGAFVSISEKIAALNVKIKNKKTAAAKKKAYKLQVTKLKLSLKHLTKYCKTLPADGPDLPPATPLPNATTVAWSTDAQSVAANTGSEYLYFCPANPSDADLNNAIYGDDIYTSDSPICITALHAGLFKRKVGGNVKFKILGSQNVYLVGIRNGISSNFYTAFPTSYVYVNIDTDQEYHTDPIPTISWSQSTGSLNSFTESTFSFYCTPNGAFDSVWGTDRYTYDSSICTAAVHAGKISHLNGGIVTVQIKPDPGSYSGSTRHGVTSNNYGPWSGSFIFP